MNKRELSLMHEFVEFVPADILEGKLYISIPYATATHKCCCGCGKEVVTPLSPTDWKLIFDGQSVSLDPSIGNWSFDCRSHYWIKRNRVIWAEGWSQERVESGRAYDRHLKKAQYRGKAEDGNTMGNWNWKNQTNTEPQTTKGFWSKIRGFWPF